MFKRSARAKVQHFIIRILIITSVFAGSMLVFAQDSIEANQVALDWYQNAWNEGNFDNIEDYIDENLVVDFVFNPEGEEEQGIEGFIDWITFNRTLTPDVEMVLVDSIITDTQIAVHTLYTGTISGGAEYDYIVTNAEVNIDAMAFMDMNDGKIVRINVLFDSMLWRLAAGQADPQSPAFLALNWRHAPSVNTVGYLEGLTNSNLNGVEAYADWGTYETFLTALQTADMQETLNGDEPFVVLAPSDAAFAALPEGELDALMSDSDALTALLEEHIMPGLDAPFPDAPVTSLAGNDVFIEFHDDGPPTFNGGAATLVAGRIFTNNGVIILIDTVLQPNS